MLVIGQTSRTGPEKSGKPAEPQQLKSAFSRLDLGVLIALICLLGSLAVAAQLRGRVDAPTIACMKNLQQILVAFKVWSLDNNDRFPPAVPGKDGGTLECVDGGNAFRHFQAMSNELNTPNVLICPTDTRKAALNFGTLANANVSYFVGVDARTNLPHSWIAGDRNLTINGVAVSAGLVSIRPDDPVGWGENLHNRQGNIVAMGSGLLDAVTEARLRLLVRSTGTNLIRLAIP